MSGTVTEQLRMFYVDHRHELYAYAVSITRDRPAAEDAIHAAFHRLLDRADLPSHLRPYVFRSVRNAALDELRRVQVHADCMLAAGPGAVADSPGGVGALQPDEVEAGLRELSPDERETIVLKIYSDLTFQEIATLRDTPLPTIASWYRRGLEKLKTRLGKEIQ